jgi:hypothetical protein
MNFADLKARLIVWYDQHIVAAWYKSWALWTGIAAAILPNLPDWLQMLLDNWAASSIVVPQMTDTQREGLRLVLLLVVLPLAKAWQQKSMREAALKQAVKTGQVVAEPGTEEVLVNVKA